jgi:hypothetical protein
MRKKYPRRLIISERRCKSGFRYQIAMGNRNVNKRPKFTNHRLIARDRVQGCRGNSRLVTVVHLYAR